MLYKIEALNEAALRHTRYYLTKLTRLKAAYQSTPEKAVPALQKIMPQLRQAYTWLHQHRDINPGCTTLLIEMIAAGMGCVRMVVSAAEWKQWLQHGIELAEETGQPVYHLEFVIEQGVHAFRQGNLDDAQMFARTGEEQATRLDKPGTRAQCYYLQALVYQKLGKTEAAHQAVCKAEADFEQVNDLAGVGKVRSFLAQAAIDNMNYDRAHDLLEQNIRLWDETGNLRQKAVEQYQLGVMFSNRTMYARSDGYLHDARAAFKKFADRRYEAYSLQILSSNAMERDFFEAALTYIEDAYDLFQTVNDQRGVAGALNYMGRIYEKQADYHHAIESHQQAATIASEIDYRFALTDAYRSLCEIYLITGDSTKAQQNIYMAINVGETSGNQLLLLAVLSAAVGVLATDECSSMAQNIAATIQATTHEPLILQMLDKHTGKMDIPDSTSLSVDEACTLVKNLYQ